MSFARTATAIAILTAVVWAGSASGREITDPYDILNRHFEAAGGLDRLRAEETQYFEGDLSIGGMQGTIRSWTEKPGRKRVDVEVGPLHFAEGDKGDTSWTLDTNGKVQKITKSDDATLKRREVDRRVADYEYADAASDVFTANLERIEDVDGVRCYAVKVTNNINTDYRIYFIAADDFRLVKEADIRGEESADTYYGDYREAGGIMVAFYQKEVPYQTGQAQEVRITTYEYNPEIDPSVFDPPEEAGRDFRFREGFSAEEIPFRFIGNHLYVPVTTGGLERLWILDTGASMSVLDRAFARELGLETEGDLKGVGGGGTVDLTFAVLPGFEVKGISFDEQSVAVLDMNELIRRLGVEIAGILGFDFLSRFVTRVDYANEVLSFYDPEHFEYAGGGTPLDAHVKDSVFETAATLDGEHTGTWLFDIGAGGMSLDAAYAQLEGYADRPGVLRLAHGAANEYQIKVVRVGSVEFAGFTIDSPLVNFRYGGDYSVRGTDRIGTLGNNVFRNFVVYVDYAGELVIIEKGAKFNQPWPEDGSGLSVGWTVGRDGVEVLYVSPDTPAERTGFRKGDILESLDGAPIEPREGVLAVRDALAEGPGVTHQFVITRDGREEVIGITLEDLYR
jgi:hypothetical protein